MGWLLPGAHKIVRLRVCAVFACARDPLKTMNDQNAKGSTNPRSSRPMNFWAAVCVALICATVAYVVHQFLNAREPGRPQRLWTPVGVTPEGSETVIQPATRRLEFWTPSARTKDHLAREDGNIRERDKWEMLANDEPVHQFGQLLRTNSNVLGYRRAEVWGHGRTSLKPGWWWTMTVTTNYTLQQLVQSYRGFWKSSNAIFVEKIENPGEE